jgi:hypothetical protein
LSDEMNGTINISGTSPDLSGNFGFSWAPAVCKQILNFLSRLAHGLADQERFAGLPLRQLEDIGITIAERDAQLRWTTPAAPNFPKIFDPR